MMQSELDDRRLVVVDTLTSDRLKMEAARSIREDFLHQNSFHEVDTYTPLDKQRRMPLVVGYYEKCSDALGQGRSRWSRCRVCLCGDRPV